MGAKTPAITFKIPDGEIPGLSRRQNQVLRLAAEGLSDKEISERLSISRGTVRLHLGAAGKRLGKKPRAGLAVLFVLNVVSKAT
jgi:DNA-binding NarL/FixJ family response regulator